MASIGELSVIIKADDQFTPTLKQVSIATRSSLTAVRQLASGVMWLGVSFMSMGAMLKNTKTAMGETIGNTLMFVGSIATAIGSSLQFVLAIGKMVKALKALQLQQILTQAFSGPAGWAMLAGGVAVAGLTIAATNQKVANTATAKTQPLIINNYIDGKKTSGVVKTNLINDAYRNNTSGVK